MQMKSAIAALSQSMRDMIVAFPVETEVSKAGAAMAPPTTDVMFHQPPDIDEIASGPRRRMRSGNALSPCGTPRRAGMSLGWFPAPGFRR